MVAYLKSFDFILESLVPRLIESLARLDVEVDWTQFLNPSGDFIFEDVLKVWLILEEVRRREREGGGNARIQLVIKMNELYQFHLRPEEDLFHGLLKWLLLLLIFVSSKILKFLAEIVRRNFIE